MRIKIYFLLVFVALLVRGINAQTTYTVGSGGTYSSIGAAITAAGTITNTPGGVVVELQNGYTEANVSISVSTTDATHPVVIRPAAGATCSITSTTTTAALTLNGCKYVTIDGRPGGAGDMSNIGLTIQNTNAANASSAVAITAGTSGAGNGASNTIQYTNIRSATLTNGTVLFNVSYTNTIDHCNIFDATSGTPANGIYSASASTNTISNCNIYNYYRPTGDQNGIYLGANTTGWTITGNSFYNTGSSERTITGGNWTCGIRVANSSGNGYVITNNYIGGQASLCGGGKDLMGISTAAVTTGFIFKGISLNVGATTATSVQGNTIQNIAIASGHSTGGNVQQTTLIAIEGGSVDIGTTKGNTLGSQTGTGSITYNYLNNAAAAISFFGIWVTGSTGTVNIKNNRIGGFSMINPSSGITVTGKLVLDVIFIDTSTRTAAVSIENNIVGNTATGINDGTQMSIQNMRGTALSYQTNAILVLGSTGTVLIKDNTIANIYAVNLADFIRGIGAFGTVTYTISGNTIRDLISNISAAEKTPTAGIHYEATGANSSIYGNNIYNITSLTTGSTCGISLKTATAISAYNNKIYNIYSTDRGFGFMLSYTGAAHIIYNNFVHIGNDIQGNALTNRDLVGIREFVGSTNYYYNTVYVSGSGTTGNTSSYAFFSGLTATVQRYIKNNIFCNTRVSNSGTAKHYAARFWNLTLTGINYNDYVSTAGASSYLNSWDGTDKTLSAWRTSTGQEANSLNVAPVFVSVSGITPDLHMTKTLAANSNLIAKGSPISGITNDLDGNIRETTNPGIGADEFSYNKWTGTGNWNTPANWTLGTPTSESPVVKVLSGVLTNDQTSSVSNIFICPGSGLINTGVLTASTLTIQSNSSGTGSFVDKGTFIAASDSVQQYLTGTGGSTPSGRGWYISSPVAAANSGVFTASGGNGLWSHTEGTSGNGYREITDDVTTLNPGQGYVARIGADGNVTFTGTLNTGEIVKSGLTRTGTTLGKRGFHLMGNPYPSHLDWSQVYANSTNVRNQIWFKTSTNFAVWNGSVGTNGATGFIPPMQAFWMRVDQDEQTGTLRFNSSMGTHQSGNNLRSAQASDLKMIRLVVTNDTNSDEAIAVYNDTLSDDFDSFDATKMSVGSSAVPEIYTLAGTEQVAINGLKCATLNEELPLGFKTGASNSFSIKAAEISNFDTDTKLVLVDKTLNTEQDLTDGVAYNFTSDAVNTTSRFAIVLKSASITTSINHADKEKKVLVYTNQNNGVTVKIPDGKIESAGIVSVTDVAGKRVLSQALVGKTMELDGRLASGVYLVSVILEGKMSIQKVVIK